MKFFFWPKKTKHLYTALSLKVYEWESRRYGKLRSATKMSQSEMEWYAKKAWEAGCRRFNCHAFPPRLVYETDQNDEATWNCNNGDHFLRLPPWAQNRIVVLHELAHGLYFYGDYGKFYRRYGWSEPHNAQFVAIFWWLLVHTGLSNMNSEDALKEAYNFEIEIDLDLFRNGIRNV